MGYTNQVYKIPLGNSGMNASENSDNIPPSASVPGSININLHKGGVGKRGGTAHVDSAAMSGTPQIVGLADFTVSGTQYVVRATGDGKIYKDDTNTITTGLSSANKIMSFAEMNNVLYCTNGTNVPHTWTGSGNTSALANVPTDWGTAGPVQFIKHGFANSERLWGFYNSATPYTVYASKLNDGVTIADFSDAAVLTLYIDTGDSYGVIGGFEFQDRIFAVGKTKTFQIQDVDAAVTNWGYNDAGWSGGAASHRLIVKTQNDVFFMMDDGEIYSITGVQQYGDYKAASITRASYMNNYINDYIDLSKINQFHAVYDPELRAIKWFVVRSGMTTVDTALVYFIDKTPETGWTVHQSPSTGSGYDAVCSALIKQSTGGYKVYTGDDSGFVWKLEQTTKSDNSLGYAGILKTSALNFEDSRTTKRYDSAFLSLKPVGDYDLTVYVDYDSGTDSEATTVNMGSSGGRLGSFVLGTDKLGGSSLIEGHFDLGYVGKRIGFQISNSTAGQDFFLSQILVDFKPVGLRP